MTFIIAFFRRLTHADRHEAMTRERDIERRRADHLLAERDYYQAETERLRALIEECIETVDIMHGCNVEMERRNDWLERRRSVVLRRWWRKGLHRTVGARRVLRWGW